MCECLRVVVSKTWSVARTSGALVPGTYGHTSVYDTNTRIIFVHGGYMSTNYSSSVLSDGLYSYDPTARTWYVTAYCVSFAT
jgi:Na+-transporting NADH:ubiquinone oxidoreductase subunit NqrF